MSPISEDTRHILRLSRGVLKDHLLRECCGCTTCDTARENIDRILREVSRPFREAESA